MNNWLFYLLMSKVRSTELRIELRVLILEELSNLGVRVHMRQSLVVIVLYWRIFDRSYELFDDRRYFIANLQLAKLSE